MNVRALVARIPEAGTLTVPFAILLVAELFVNRVLTRASIFIPGGGGPMAVAAALGTVLVAAVALLAFVALLSVAVADGPFAPRALTLALLAASVASIPFPSPEGGIVLVSLTAATVVAFLAWGIRRSDHFPVAILVALAIPLLAYGSASSAANQVFRTGLPTGPEVFAAGELLYLAALAVLGFRSLDGVRPLHAAIASGVVGVLLVGYARSPALFATLTTWSLGYVLVIPPLLFAAVWLGTAGAFAARKRGDITTATVLVLLLAAGIDLRISYVAAAVVFAVARWSARHAATELGVPPPARASPQPPSA